MRRALAVAAAAALAALTLTACGGSGSGQAATPAPATSAPGVDGSAGGGQLGDMQQKVDGADSAAAAAESDAAQNN